MILKRRELLKTLGAANAAMVLGACAPGAGPAPASGGSAAQAPKVKRGGTVNFPHSGLDTIEYGQSLFGSVIQSLIEYRADTYNDPTLVPTLAEKWEVSPDAKSITFTLRKGVKWANVAPVNGRPFTSADVAFNVQYWKTTPRGAVYNPVDRVETPDPQTAIFRLKNPAVSFLISLANENVGMIAKESVDADPKLGKGVVGTGPFMLKSFTPGERFSLVRNPDYWEVSDIDQKPLPYLDGVDYFVNKDNTSRLAGLRTGQFHSSVLAGTLTPNEAEDMRKGGLTVIEGTATITRDVYMNFNIVPIFKNVQVRRAVAMAIDREGWIRTQLDNAGFWQSYVPIEGYGWDQATLKQKFKLETEKAKAMITAAGAAGTKVRLAGLRTSTSGLTAESAQFIASDLAKIGLQVELDMFPGQPDIQAQRVTPNSYDMLLHVHGNGFDPDDYLRPLLSTTPNNVTGAANYGKIADTKLDDMILGQAREVDIAKRRTLIRQIEDYLYEQSYFTPLGQPKILQARSAKVQGPNTFHSSRKSLNLHRIWLDQ